MTDAEFNEITERVKAFRPVLEKYKDDEAKLKQATEEVTSLVAETEDYALYITQYNYDKPKFNLLARSVFSLGIASNAFLNSFNLAFSIDNAAGKQLDVLGRLLGIERLLDYKPPEGSREMSDEEYRLAMRLTIAKNTWDGTLGSISKIYSELLGEEASIVVKDNQDMSIDLEIYTGITSREANIMENAGLLLCPVGVWKNVVFIGGGSDVTLYGGVGISSFECVNCAIAEWE